MISLAGCGSRVSNQLKNFTSISRASCSAAFTYRRFEFLLCSTMGLSKTSSGAPLNDFRTMPRENAEEEGRVLLNTKAMLLASDLGKMVARVWSV